uniref:Uncharacterized protein n=1 Tax=Oryza brachyantha TaxID=4533 RepID=J3N7U6_ORYBR
MVEGLENRIPPSPREPTENVVVEDVSNDIDVAGEGALKVLAPPNEKYDGSVNLAEFFQMYSTIIEAAGGDDRVMANFFPMVLKGQACAWLMNLPCTPWRTCASSSSRTSKACSTARGRRRNYTRCSDGTTIPFASTSSSSARYGTTSREFLLMQ